MNAVIVGRERELRMLDAFLHAAAEAPSALVLHGEAGMGKSTLWAHCVERAEAASTRVLDCRPSASERQLAFAALCDLLAGVTDDVLPALPGPQRRALEVALLLEETGDDPPEARVIASAFLSAVRELARAGPVLVAVDDVQWIDAPSAAVLEFAARRLQRVPVGVLVAQRSEGGADMPLGLERAFGDSLATIEVGPLTLGAVTHLLRVRLDVSLSRPVLHRVYETSGGNPFYALELGRALARHSGAVDPGEPLPVPTTLEGLVGARLEGLSSSVRRALEVVSALSDATVQLVEAALDDDEAGISIDAAVLAGVLQASGNRLRFSHPLLASGVYGRLGPHERLALHARLAEVVTDPEERAHQLAVSTTAPDEIVAAAIESASVLAEARGAPMAAAELLERAIQLTPTAECEARRRRIVELCDLCVVNGDVERAAVLAEEFSRDASDEERLDARARLAIVRLSEGRRADVGVLVEEILASSGADDRARAIALILSATVDVRRLGRRETLARGREAVAIGERLGDLDVVRDALVGVAIDAAWLGEPFVDDVERAAAMGHVHGIFPVGHRSESVAAIVRMLFGDELSTTRTVLEARYRDAVASDSAEAQAEALSTLSELERRAGRLEVAARYGEAGLELGDVYLRANLCFMTGFARALQGHLDEAEHVAQEALGVLEHAPASAGILIGWLLGTIDLLRGDDRAAVEHMRGLPATAESLGIENPTPIQFQPDLAEALLGAGRIDDAGDVVTLLENRSLAVGHAWALAAAHRCRGLVQAADGDLSGALVTLDEAVVISGSIAAERPLEHARALLAQGSVLRRSKRRRNARTALARAAEIFETHGARPWAERTQAELFRIAGRAPGAGELTETERRVAELVVEGLSNKEVAGRLFVTVRTVEANLTKVYAKLGVRSRTELVGRLTRPEEAADAQ